MTVNINGKMGRKFVMGDIHGAYRALIQCLERSKFNYKADVLIFLGDVADGWPETKACVDQLLQIRNLVYVLGNHDFWTLEWMEFGDADEVWLSQGGLATVNSYHSGVPKRHVDFFKNAASYHIDNDKLFVHAGIDPDIPIHLQGNTTFLWDRTLAYRALENYTKNIQEKITDYNEVYIGHTPITELKPIKSGEVWLMDTGAGWSGVLSMMDIESKEVFTSDLVPTLYPGVEGRKRRIR